MKTLTMITVILSILFLDFIQVVNSTSTASGVQFLISPHGLYNNSINASTPSIYLQMYAEYSPKPVEVEIVLKCFNLTNSTSERKINLTTAHTEMIPRPKIISGNVPIIHITSQSPISVFVTITDGETTVETFRAVPVNGWGRRYHAVTLGFRYSLVILTNQEPNNVTVTFRAVNPEGLTFNLMGINQLNGKVLSLTLYRYKGFEISMCSNSRCEGSLTGTIIVGEKPVGVITGNCRSVDDNMACESRSRREENYVAEMLMPQETYGKQFIIFQPFNRFDGSYCVLVAGSSNTTINRYRTVPNTKANVNAIILSTTIGLNKEGDWSIIDSYLVDYINSTNGFMVMCVQRSYQEENGPLGGPSFLFLVPMELFYFKYMIMSPAVGYTTDYVVCVVEYISSSDLAVENHNPNITIDVMDKIKVSRLKVQGNLLWKAMYFQIQKGAKFFIFSKTSTFGCYQYGIGKNTSYMHSAGFISSPINTKCEKTILVMNHMDLTDNDCDGRLDEELANHKDDDGDKLIDEDANAFSEYMYNPYLVWKALPKDLKVLSVNKTSTTRSISKSTKNTTTITTTVRPTTKVSITAATNNQITVKPQTTHVVNVTIPENPNIIRRPWTEWHCSPTCGDPFLHRERSCVDISNVVQVAVKCDTETKPGHCYAGIVCPGECERFKWGLACNKTCLNCEDHCDKFKGSCTSCRPGYRDPRRSCTEECDQFHYGRNCEGKCLEKCGGQCIDNVGGVCPYRKSLGKIISYAIVVLIPAFAIGIYLFQRIKKNKEESEMSDDEMFVKSVTRSSVKVESTSVDDMVRNKPTSSYHSKLSRVTMKSSKKSQSAKSIKMGKAKVARSTHI